MGEKPLKHYKTVPGRGLLTSSAIQYRKEFLDENQMHIDEIEKTSINYSDIQNNIESLVGSIEIPVGLVGPLTFISNGNEEEAYCLGATLEGALIASMNRGAKAVSVSGGFTAEIIHQKMIRSPLFVLSSTQSARHFLIWIGENFGRIKELVESYSNHAVLHELNTDIDDKNVHVNFVYTTGDAAGQNMTTTCTWHGILWIVEKYEEEGYERIADFVLEGNGSSDKKVSQFLIDHGRGMRVTARAVIQEEAIRKILRTSSDQMLKFYYPSRKYAVENGMVGYTINASNAIAAIFAATGQDLGSVHESSVAELILQPHEEGLEVSVTLYSLVVGTVGGGTHLPKQREALQLMGCYGSGKVERFASLIAGFVLGLEMSTFAAMVSGEFAKAHEKLGRNKPSDWLQKNELDERFVKEIISKYIRKQILSVDILNSEIDNGILMNLSKRVNRKLIGFVPLRVHTEEEELSLLLKSKSTDLETIKGLHIMAASVNPLLSDQITNNKEHLEYAKSHLKEIEVLTFLNDRGFTDTPKFYGSKVDKHREIFMFIQERLNFEDLLLIDAENSPEKWTEDLIKGAIQSISKAHQLLMNSLDTKLYQFNFESASSLYEFLVKIAIAENPAKESELNSIWEQTIVNKRSTNLPKTIIHNDFNPRNVAVRSNGEICIYDWELAVYQYPHRDIIEFLSFAMDEIDEEVFAKFLHFHHELWGGEELYTWKEWKEGYIITLREYLLSRVLFYTAAEVVMKLKFAERVYKNSIQMLNYLMK